MSLSRVVSPVAILGLLLLPACSGSETPDPEAALAERNALAARAGAPLFDGMGDHSYPITTNNPDAQLYFDQGLMIDFAFNHAESIRSFRAAQRLDEDCAMCYWGEALALGPNINVTVNRKVVMAAEDRFAAHAAIQKAVARKESTTQKEQDLIDALAARYNGDPSTARAPLDVAYADAMRQLHHKYPEDDDVASLFSESLMNNMPWDYWLDPQSPKPETVEVIDALEGVLERTPDHALALHLYIHAVEASSAPERAEAGADVLADLVPGAGHLVHMPAHIYWRVGRYHDASEVNVRAAAVDEAYIAACNAQGFYPAAYYPHNIHFLWAASTMEGRSEVAIDAGRRVAANIQMEMIDEFPGVEFFHTIPMLALARFGRWDEVLSEAQPAEHLDFSNAIWRYARATAYVAKGDLEAAKSEHRLLTALLETDKIHEIDSVDYPASMLLSIADALVLGDLAMAEGELDAAIAHYRRAVGTQDELPYTEPPFWYYPTRQSLGRALLAAGDAAGAEQVYRDDLVVYPRNGWSMFGLVQSLEAQGKDATEARTRFDQVWSLADVTLSSSRI
ncbi:MAG TPA: hypothetical protein QGG47_01660 [Acidobacteriota bacterium]|nr:hypothetical protein [Acidobacteriota bacterium]